MDLSVYKQTSTKRKKRKRVGRGMGSGCGKTCGRGMRGVGARSGPGVPVWFEGGQMPLFRRIPKRGFTRGRFKFKNVRKARIRQAENSQE